MIPYGKQDVDEADIAAVVDVLRSDYLTQGPVGVQFEDAVAKYCGAEHAVSTSSGTAALHLAYLALGLGRGDMLWTSPNTFVATANAAIYCGAGVDFVDIDPHTYNLSATALEEKLKAAKPANQLPKVVAAVHFAGQSCEMEKIFELSRQYGFRVVEDASHGIGGEYKGERIGSGTYSDIAVFSFHPVKIITTGEGGMAVTNDSKLADKMRRLRSHGVTRDSEDMLGDDEGPWYYQQIELGFNYRMTDIQAALGTSQLRRIDEFVLRRHELADHYDAALEALPVVSPGRSADCRSAWHLYVVQLDLGKLGVTRRSVVERMRGAGVYTHVHYIPVHLQPYYTRLGFSVGDFPIAERYYQAAVTMPMFSRLTDDDQDYAVQTLASSLR